MTQQTRHEPAAPPRISTPLVERVLASAASGGELEWLALPAERAAEVAFEVAQLTAAAAGMRNALTFDSQPSDWNVTFARWQAEAL